MPRRGVQPDSDAGSDWFWGNHRGGGGAPLKDTKGQVVTNLRQVIKGPTEIDPLSPSEKNVIKKIHRDSHFHDLDGRMTPRDSRDRNMSPRDRINSRYDEQILSHESPKRFMSALSQMNANPTDREEKLRKEKEYQQMLRQQIEENKRKKEALYEEDIPRRQQNHTRNRGHDDRHLDRNEHNSRYSGNEEFGLDKRKPLHHTDQDSGDDVAHRHQTKGRRSERYERGHSDDDNTDGNKIDNGTQKSKHTSHHDKESIERFGARASVTKIEYDQLQSLCDKLMDQQEKLQEQIGKQAEIIKELQTGSRDAGPGRGNKGKNIERVDDCGGRSKSMQQKRVSEARQAGRIERKPSSANQKMEPRGKGVALPKVAFGGSAAIVDKKSNIAALAGKLVVGKSNRKESNDATTPGRINGRSGPSDENHNMGFKKLQASVRGGPIVVTYEDDDDGVSGNAHTRSNRRRSPDRTVGGHSGRSIELNSESEHLPMKGNSDVIGGDQLDRLLVQARRARAVS